MLKQWFKRTYLVDFCFELICIRNYYNDFKQKKRKSRINNPRELKVVLIWDFLPFLGIFLAFFGKYEIEYNWFAVSALFFVFNDFLSFEMKIYVFVFNSRV